MPLPSPIGSGVLWAVAAATLSGGLSAVSLDPAMNIIEELPFLSNDLMGVLLPFSLTAGLAFGVCGAVVARFAMGVRTAGAVAFCLASIVGIAAAVYLAMLVYDNSNDSFVRPYAVGGPLGALILAIPFAFVGRFAQPWRVIGLATLLPTLWAVGVAALLDGDAALEAPGLAVLYIGWQAIFLGLFAAAARRT